MGRDTVALLVSILALTVAIWEPAERYLLRRETALLTKTGFSEPSFDYGISLDEEYALINTSSREITITEAICNISSKLPQPEIEGPFQLRPGALPGFCEVSTPEKLPVLLSPGASLQITIHLGLLPFESLGQLMYKFRNAREDAEPHDFISYLYKKYGIDYAGNAVRDDWIIPKIGDEIEEDISEIGVNFASSIGTSSFDEDNSPEYFYVHYLSVMTARESMFSTGLQTIYIGPGGF